MKTLMGLLLLMPFETFSKNMGVYSSRSNLIKDMVEKIYPEGNLKSGFTFSKVCFEDALCEMTPVTGFFSESVEKKHLLFDDSYTNEVPLGPGSLSMRTTIRKPIIYSSVNRIYKHLKSECRKGNISVSSAETDYNHILDVALTALYSNSEEFELSVRSLKTVEDRLQLFKSVRLTD